MGAAHRSAITVQCSHSVDQSASAPPLLRRAASRCSAAGPRPAHAAYRSGSKGQSSAVSIAARAPAAPLLRRRRLAAGAAAPTAAAAGS